jgi:predicted aspartyl protease
MLGAAGPAALGIGLLAARFALPAETAGLAPSAAGGPALVLRFSGEGDRALWTLPVRLNGNAAEAVVSTGAAPAVTLALGQARQFGVESRGLLFTSVASTPLGDAPAAFTFMTVAVPGGSPKENVPVAIVDADIGHPIVGVPFLKLFLPEGPSNELAIRRGR